MVQRITGRKACPSSILLGNRVNPAAQERFFLGKAKDVQKIARMPGKSPAQQNVARRQDSREWRPILANLLGTA